MWQGKEAKNNIPVKFILNDGNNNWNTCNLSSMPKTTGRDCKNKLQRNGSNFETRAEKKEVQVFLSFFGHGYTRCEGQKYLKEFRGHWRRGCGEH